MRIDAHQHFWQLSQPFDYGWLEAATHAPIRKDFLPADLAPHLAAANLDGSIFVQTQHDVAENRWVLKLAEENPFVVGVVGWVDLASPECERQLDEFIDHPRFVGIRHVVHDEPDDDFIVREDVLRGLAVLERRGVPFDLLFYVKHLRHVPTLAERLPNLKMVIDHLAKPPIKSGRTASWLPDFLAASDHPNVYCKLSGMVTEADWNAWKVDDLSTYVRIALDLFGPERCMYGSDWPVSELAATYEEVYRAVDELTSGLSSSERDRVFGGTAMEFYGVMPAPRDVAL